MQHILITGGSGLLGRAITAQLHALGYRVAWMSRRIRPAGNSKDLALPDKVFLWNPESGHLDPEALSWSDVIIHLAGEGIADKRWTPKRKQVIIESRTKTTALLVAAMRELPEKKHLVIAASAIGFYGPSEKMLLESDLTGEGFLAYSVSEWEKATANFKDVALRAVTFRIGIVLSKNGGAYPQLLQTAMIRVLPSLGNGKQMYPWIHVDDVVDMVLFAISHPVSGTFNAVSPNPVTQAAIMNTYGDVTSGWYLKIPVPKFIIRLLLGEMADMVLLTQMVSAEKIITAGYKFKFPDINAAIRDLEKK